MTATGITTEKPIIDQLSGNPTQIAVDTVDLIKGGARQVGFHPTPLTREKAEQVFTLLREKFSRDVYTSKTADGFRVRSLAYRD